MNSVESRRTMLARTAGAVGALALMRGLPGPRAEAGEKPPDRAI